MVYKLTYTIDFGKYNGLSIKEVAEKDIGYLCWCVKNINDFVLDNETLIFLHSNCANMSISTDVSIDFVFENDDLSLKQKQIIEIENIIKANLIKYEFLGLKKPFL